ncbi:MAG: hypothetical protein WC708_19860 [Lentisphaeria bacterium]
MNMIQLGVFYVCTLLLVTCALAADNHYETVMQQKTTFDSLKSPAIRQSLQKSLNTAGDAQREMEHFQDKVVRGDIPIVNNNGIWCAVINESKTITKLANYASKDGPMTYFVKMVYTDESHKARLNERSYHLKFFANGKLAGYMRGDMQEMIEYHSDGKLKSFSSKTGNSWGTADWDEKDGKLVNDSSSIGTVIDKGTPVVTP